MINYTLKVLELDEYEKNNLSLLYKSSMKTCKFHLNFFKYQYKRILTSCNSSSQHRNQNNKFICNPKEYHPKYAVLN